MKITESVLDIIGNTPLIRLKKVTKGIEAEVLAKCEHMNPSGSIKDRIALKMIEQAEKNGTLKPDSIIVDSTTGNTGIALSFVGIVKGYRVKMLMPKVFGAGYSPQERIKIIKCYGGEIMQIPPTLQAVVTTKGGAGGVWELGGRKKCYEMEKSDSRVWWARQLSNPFNAGAHKETTGKEILEQTDGKVDAWVASIGTGGTLLGVAEALKEKIPAVKVVGVEPDTTPFTDWIKSGSIEKFLESKKIQKDVIIEITRGLINTMLEKGIVDDIIRVSDEDAREMANRLAKEEGLFVGMSSGANVFAGLEVAKKLGKGKTVVTVLVDSRDRYLGEFPEERYVT